MKNSEKYSAIASGAFFGGGLRVLVGNLTPASWGLPLLFFVSIY